MGLRMGADRRADSRCYARRACLLDIQYPDFSMTAYSVSLKIAKGRIPSRGYGPCFAPKTTLENKKSSFKKFKFNKIWYF